MPWVIDKRRVRVEFFSSDMEIVRWAQEGLAAEGDRLEDTDELVTELVEQLQERQ